jgi:hypothetical protein
LSRNRIILGAAIAAVVVGGTTAGIGVANAAVTADPAQVVAISAPRIMDNVTIAANTTQTVDIGGSTINGYSYPAALTGVTLTISAQGVGAAGGLTVWTAGQGKPGNPSLAYSSGTVFTTQVDVTTNAAGAIQLANTGAVKVKVGVTSYLLPKNNPAPVFAAIAPNEVTLAHIGVSVRNDCTCAGGGTTDLGSVTLPAGTWDVRIMGGFSGIKSTTVLAPGEEIIGGLFLASDDHISSGFGQVITQNQGVKIPHTVTGTLTVDPTDNLSDFITLTSSTTVHVLAYAYSTASTDESALNVKANIRTAKFLKVS